MAPTFEEGTVGGFFPSIIAVSLFGVTACFLALCARCKRKDRNRMPLQDGLLPEEAMELSSFNGSVTSLRERDRADSRGKDQRPTSLSPPSNDDGTASSSSFIVIPQRGLPQIPSAELLPPEQTYSNLSFPKRGQQEVLYESVPVTGEGGEDPTKEEVVTRGKGDQEAGADYARVLKGKKKEDRAEPDAGSAPMLQQSALTPQTGPIEEMYSVVCKDKKKKKMKKKKKEKECEGLGEERTPQVEISQGNCQVVAVSQESDGMAAHQSSSFQSPIVEPCYESVSSESWRDVGRKQTTEPAYETVDTHWKNSRGKGKLNRNIEAENLYESIENVTVQFQNHFMTAHFEI